MAKLRVYSTSARIVPKSEQTNIRVYSVKSAILARPNIRVHQIVAGAVVYRLRIRRSGAWRNVQAFVRKGNSWK